MSEWLRRLNMLLHWRRWRRELDEEMRLHRDLRGDDRRFGNELLQAERAREAWGWRWLETLLQDARHGLRLLARTPVATLLALASLALGIGANLALYAILQAIVLRPLPVAHPEELARVEFTGTRRPSPIFTNPLWEQVRDHQTAFTSAFAWMSTEVPLNRSGEQRNVRVTMASGHYFRTLDVGAASGRLFDAGDDRPGCPAVADISAAYWQSHYAGAASAIGSALTLNGQPFQIIGVTRPGFTGMDVGTPFDVVVPLCAERLLDAEPMLEVRDAWWLMIAGRLRPGESLAAAGAQLNSGLPAWLQATVPPWTASQQQSYLKRRVQVVSVSRGISPLARQYGTSLDVLLGIAGLVLLVTCANLAGLMLARGEARRAEIATRLALGASRARVVRQLLTESLLLSGGGAAAGCGLAVWACRALERFWSGSAFTWNLNVSVDGGLLAAAVGLALATGLLVGLAPALRATRHSLAGGARADFAGGAAAWRRLAAVQIALSLVLLSGAGLFLRSFLNLSRVDLGFDPARVTLISLSPRRGLRGAELQAQFGRDLEALRALPGVEAASESFLVPTSGLQWDTPLLADQRRIPDAYFNAISSGYFATLRTPLLAGRDFTAEDRAGSEPVVILNRSAALALFPAGLALGQTVRQEGGDMVAPARVVGIVADAKYDSSLRTAAPPTGYYPLAQLRQQFPTTSFLLRSPLPAAGVSSAAVKALAAADPTSTFTTGTLERTVAGDVKTERLLGVLSALFGGLALALTAIGLYGVTAHGVQRRRREFGLRLALGAKPRSVARLAIGGIAGSLVAGIAAGAGLAWAGSRGLAHTLGPLLFELQPGDVATIVGAATLLAGLCLLAAWLPARKAARTDPMAALREE